MNKKDERRVFERHNHDAPIIWAYYNTDQFIQAVMCNYSKDGMCFKTPDEIYPGSDIYIMMENYSADTIHAELYEGYFAEVKWCRRRKDPEMPEYTVGVKYYKTVIG
ncbi:MAG: PilZ domain-containing protein [Desulfobacterales bacterium]